MTIAPPPGGRRRPDSGRASTRAELDATKAAVAARRDGLTAVRASAAKWQAGLAALVGVVTGAVGIGVRDTIGTIAPEYGLALAVLLTVAFLAAFVATLLALRASGGIPRLVKTVTAREDDDHVSAKAAARSLKSAIWVTTLALFALLAGLWVSWFAPTPPGRVAVVETPAGAVCGTAAIVEDRLLVSAEDGTVHVIDLGEVTGWKKIDHCP